MSDDNPAGSGPLLATGQPSDMAQQAAILRGVHQLLDAEPRVLDDPLALRILGPGTEQWVREHLDDWRPAWMGAGRGLTVIRSRFAEDELLQALAAGTRQYVVLGAGLDTFAYRRRDLAGRLTVFEVDHPATQAWKRARLAETGIAIPPHVRYVPLDFQASSLEAALPAGGFDRAAPAFFSWLGVTYYLTPQATLDTLRFIAGQRATAGVVFDFALDDTDLTQQYRDSMRRLLERMARRGEPWLTRFHPPALVALLHSLGFRRAQRLTPELAWKRYLSGRTDNLGSNQAVQVMAAST
jgi:methyltransferase (TIGR00027 family)